MGAKVKVVAQVVEWQPCCMASVKNTHIAKNIVGKANQRVFMMCQLKKGSVSAAELIRIYKSIIRPILEYACQVWHSALTVKLTKDLEHVQKQALRIVYRPGDYCQHLARSGLPRLSNRRLELCRVFYTKMKNPHHGLDHLIPDSRVVHNDLRNPRTLPVPRARTDRFKNSFVPWCVATVPWCIATVPWCIATVPWCIATVPWCIAAVPWCIATVPWCIATVLWCIATVPWCIANFD